MVSFSQILYFSWDNGSFCLSVKLHGLLHTKSIHETTLSVYIQHHGPWPLQIMRPWTTVFLYNIMVLPIPYMRSWTTIYTTLITMVSFHQFHTWNQRPFYLYIQHHGLLLSIPYMRPGITICIYNTMVSFSPSPYMRPYSFCRPLYLFIQHHGLFAPIPNMLTMDHYICLYSIMVSSHQFHTWEQGPLLLSIRFHVLFSPIPYMKKETPLSIYNTMISSHRFHTRDQGPLYLPIHYHGLFLPIIYMRTWTTLSLYTTPWSLLTNSIHEIMDHSICLYNTIVSSHQFHTWDQGSLSVYTTPWSLLTNFIHETMDHSLSIQHHGLFSPVSYMRP